MRILALIFSILGAFAFSDYSQAQVIQSTAGGGSWSQASTWNRISGSTSQVPVAGDHVIIVLGNPVVLDSNTGIQDLARIEVHDSLTVADTQDYSLGVSRIDVGGNGMPGSLIVGSQSTRFSHQFILTLTDRYLQSLYRDPLENMSVDVHDGSILQLFGKAVDAAANPISAWVKLQSGSSLTAGATSMILEFAPNWAVGDQIVIASTDYDFEQAEELTITAIGPGGTSITFTPSIQYGHHGIVERGIIDERAEVGLLTHNIVIQGLATGGVFVNRGGHMRFLKDGAGVASTTQLSRVEIRQMGWYGALARYPVHWHFVGDAPDSFIEYSSIHHCNQRFVVVHQTNSVTVERNVCYDTWGHGIFLEDKVEEDNRILGNLCMSTRRPTHLDPGRDLGDDWSVTGEAFFTPEDETPAAFWISHTNNTIEDNVAGGSEGHGIYYGTDATQPEQPPVRFARNTAHSNAINGYFQDKTRLIAKDTNLPNPFSAESEFIDFTAYKNRNAGIWHRAYGVTRWIRARVADNRFGVYLGSEGFHLDAQPFGAAPFSYSVTGAPGLSVQTLEDSDIIGETNNRGSPSQPAELNWPTGARSLPYPSQPQTMLKGVELYDGLIEIQGSRFYDFQDVLLPTPITKPWGTHVYRVSTGISSRGFYSLNDPGNPFHVDSRTLIMSSTFANVQHPALFPIPHGPVEWSEVGVPINAPPNAPNWGPNGVAAALIYDTDGSIPGNAPGTYVTNNTPLLRPPGFPTPTPLFPLTFYAAPLHVPGPGTVSDYAYGQFLFSIFNRAIPQWTHPTTEITYIDLESVNRPGNSYEVYEAMRSAAAQILKRFPMNLLLNVPGGAAVTEHYRITYPPGHSAQDDPRTFILQLQFSEQGRHALFEIPYDGSVASGPNSVQVISAAYPKLIALGNAVNSVDEVKNSSTVGDYYYDPNSKKLYIRPTLLPWAGTEQYTILSGREVSFVVQG